MEILSAVISEPVNAGSGILGLVASLGGSAAALTVVWFFMNFLKGERSANEVMYRQIQDRHDLMYSRMQAEIERIAIDKGLVIRDVTSAMTDIKMAVKENTIVTQRLEGAIIGLAASVARPRRPRVEPDDAHEKEPRA